MLVEQGARKDYVEAARRFHTAPALGHTEGQCFSDLYTR